MFNSTAKLVSLLLSFAFFLTSCVSTNPWLQETGKAAFVPKSFDTPFSEYIQDSRKNIHDVLEQVRFQNGESPYLGGYTLEETTNMRAPFQWPKNDETMCQDTSKGGGKGFLLIHGLTDSPYLMSSVSDSLKKEYPCALIRAVLLPGHGTVAGDSLTMKHEDWMRITDYGVQSFQNNDKITDLYLVGFSTGTALAIRHMQDGQRTDKIKGLILLSTAVKAKTKFAFAAGIVGLFKDWADAYQERDAARYESFSFNAGAEFYELTKNLISEKYKLNVPVIMAVSADDDTIDAGAARDFFCNYTSSGKRALIWYESRHPEKNSNPPCSDIASVQLGSIEKEYQHAPFRFANYSHLAITMSPGDPHYGVKGKYRNCKSYENKGKAGDFDNCQQGTNKSIFGEKDINSSTAKEELDYDYWRRGTFNPDYDRLEKSIFCFTNDTCQMESVLDLSK